MKNIRSYAMLWEEPGAVDDENEGRERIRQGAGGIYSDDIVPGTARQWLNGK